jgi:lysophospholipase L1-like esterase
VHQSIFMRRRTLGTLVLLASIALWLPQSDVLQLVIKQHPVLLGRYSLERFSVLLIVTPLLWLLAGLLFSHRRFDRELAFQTISITGSCLLGLLLVVILSSMIIPARYEVEPFSPHFYRTLIAQSASATGSSQRVNLQGNIVHRKPGLNLSISYDDVPLAARTYPGSPPGYPRVTGKLTTDSRGFRNRQALDRADVVAVGDSFTEGNRVSDEDAWPEVLARNSKLSVYNLGISTLNLAEYLTNFVTYGLELKPRILIVMFFEGNDFVPQKHAFRLKKKGLLADSPLKSALNNLLLRTFGPINADAPLPPNHALSWMPVVIRAEDTVHYYSFKPGSLNDLLWTPQAFTHSPDWIGTARTLGEMRQIAQANDIRFILAYAPVTSHVILPLIRDQVADKGLHGFLAAGNHHELPPATGFKDYVYALLDTKENVLREFCQTNGIEFISLTPMLRARMAAGEQVFYTYDMHWSPLGQRAVGKALAQYLQMHKTDQTD